MGIYVMDCFIAAIGFMSIFDLCCTLKWISANPYMEANPLMRWLWIMNPILFIVFKIVITLLFCFVAHRIRDNRLMRRLIWLPFCVYVLVIFVHCGG